MSEGAVSFIDYMEGTLKELALGISTEMHVRNVNAHVQNALYHADRTPEIDAAAGRLLMLAREFGQRNGGMAIGPQAKAAKAEHLARMRDAYLALRKLLERAQPSAISRALGL